MSVSNPAPTTTAEVRGRTSDSFGRGERSLNETKPFPMTSEFWMTLAGIAAVLIAGYVIHGGQYTLFHAWMLATVIASAYIVSRGLAKAGSSRVHYEGPDRR